MKILVRLPNWLGDMVMAVGFLNQLKTVYPGAEISLVAKKGIHKLLPLLPPHHHVFVFDKKEYRGLKGLYRFGKKIRAEERFDLFFVLPDSFSSAWMAFASGAKKTIGYKKDLRQLLLSHAYPKPPGLHRAEEYLRLLELYTGRKADQLRVLLPHQFPKEDYIAININSEASSRRLTEAKAVSLINDIRKALPHRLLLVGAPWESTHIESVISKLKDRSGVENSCNVSLVQLAEVLASAQVVLSTDSGPAHLANALGTPTVVLFGAGREASIAPYNAAWNKAIRLGQLSCEPCEKNTCVRFGIPQCLERLDHIPIIEAIKTSWDHE